MSEKTFESGGAQIAAEAFGDPADPALLLIMGQMASMLWWPEELCERLADGGRFVIRYDNRDTGHSTSYEPGEPPYGLDEMAADAIAVLDGYGVDRADLVGMSMGGVIAQLIAVAYPARVASVTAISTTSIDGPDPDLPGPSAEYMEHAAAAEGLDWSDTEALGEFLVADSRQIASSRHPFDEAAAREHVARDLERTVNPASLSNHATLSGGEAHVGKLGQIEVPFLVVHGSADPLFPPEHGAALAEQVPGATMVTIEGGGHELHRDDWDRYVEAIIGVTEPAA
ncbi:MAG: alpha/beta fold hydrolase [Actinomycetota bacterium]|nr:alpha/beta fold hydrolase [Actinomycetota bacterium]